MKYTILLRLFCFSLLLPPLNAYAVEEDIAPESSTGLQSNVASGQYRSVVVTAHPLATKAGFNALKQGGTAADAAVAIQAMLTLVEPQSSGIGGGAFLLYWDQSNKRLRAYDGRETAPLAANSTLFYQDGKPLSWVDALVGGRSVGTPGVLKMLELTQKNHGKLAWHSLFNDTINQAKQGFEVSPRLHKLIASGINPGLNRYSEAREYFYLDDGSPLPIGFIRKNQPLATSLSMIAQQGSDAFYKGAISQQIIEKVRSIHDNPGILSTTDFEQYQTKERDPICLPYNTYKVCGFPPPTSGGVTVLQILKLLEQTDFAQLDPHSVAARHLFTQASRLAFADRGRYLADSDYVDVPLQGLLAPNYLNHRAGLINPKQDNGNAKPGLPLGFQQALADDQSPELPSTSHFVVVDQWGNSVSMTTSIEMAFGSTVMVGGFLLNNQLTDFSFIPMKNGQLIANRVQPGKRPRSSMSPFMVFDADGQLYAAIGSPGGSRIINYVAESLLFMLNTDMTLQEAVNVPHISNRNGLTELEANTQAETLADPLKIMGHSVKVRDLNSGLHAVKRLPNGKWESGVDNRREGLALGEN